LNYAASGFRVKKPVITRREITLGDLAFAFVNASEYKTVCAVEIDTDKLKVLANRQEGLLMS